MDLNEARREIAAVDAEMTALFLRRMAAVREIAAWKAAHELPVYDPAQEARVLAAGAARVAGEAAPLRKAYLDFLRAEMDVSKDYQRALPAAPSAPAGVRRFAVHGGPPAGYFVCAGAGLLERAGALLDLRRRVFLLTDTGVPEVYAQTLAAQCEKPFLLRLPQGAAGKTPETLTTLLRILLDDGFTRGDCLVAVGGGTVGDLGGLAAALYMRGIDFYNCPTTVLAMADAAVGGKTAVDLEGCKNAVGTFYRPRAVLMDAGTLATLPAEQVAAGLVEAVKLAAVCDADAFADMERDAELPARAAVYAFAAAVRKAELVETDERDRGARHALNFGHTIGHAIEAVTRLPHGVCVGLGMLPMCAPDARGRIAALLTRLGLPTETRADPDAVYDALLHDKKRGADGRVTAVFVEKLGTYSLRAVEPDSLRAALETVVRK